MSAHFADRVRPIGDGDEVDVAFTQEGMALLRQVGAQHPDFEEWTRPAAETDAHAHHERDRDHESKEKRAAVAHELEIARMPYCKEPPHHARSSLPVSSRK